MTNLDYLFNIQKYLIETNKNSPATFGLVFAKNGALQMRELIFLEYFFSNDDNEEFLEPEFKKKYFTEYESSVTTFLLRSNYERVKFAIEKYSDYVFPKDITLGTLPLGQLNACVFKGPVEGHLITFNNGFLPLLWRLIKNFTEVQNFSMVDGNKQFLIPSDIELAKKTTNLDDIEDSISAYLIQGYVSDYLHDSLYFTRTEHFQMAKTITRDIYFFVMAHELAHLLLNHTSQSQNIAGDIHVDVVTSNWIKEFHADQLALEFTLHYFVLEQKQMPHHICVSIFLFYSIIETFEHFTNSKESETHPSAAMRREIIQQYIQKKFPEIYDVCIDHGNFFSKLFFDMINLRINNISERIKDIEKNAGKMYFLNNQLDRDAQHDILVMDILNNRDKYINPS